MDTSDTVVVIVGPTASGKTALAIDLTQKLGGEIICADSRTVYRDMDIGTAKPTCDEQAGIPHWGLDIASPDQRYTAAEFKRYAVQAIDDIQSRGKLPVVVGGTGLYVDGLLFDYDFPAPPSDDDRQRFESMSPEALTKYCIDNNIELPQDNKNTRRLLKAVYTNSADDKRKREVRMNSIVVGIATDKRLLEQRIATRTEQMFADGVVDEAKRLGKKYGWDAEAMTSNVYRSIQSYLDGNLTIEEAKQDFIVRDRQLAKRQMTWFRRNPYIMWGSVDDCRHYVEHTITRQ